MKNRKLNDMEETATHMTDHARDAFASMNSSFMKAIDKNRTITQNLFQAMQEESLRFMNQRLEHTSRCFERGRDVQGLPALMALQHEWFMDMAHDYAELNKRLGEALQEATEQSVEHVNEVVADAATRTQKAEAANDRAAA
jgi:hypothetical protein